MIRPTVADARVVIGELVAREAVSGGAGVGVIDVIVDGGHRNLSDCQYADISDAGELGTLGRTLGPDLVGRGLGNQVDNLGPGSW